MKTVSSILVALLMIVSGCGGGSQSVNETDTLITVDVTKSYSQKKELTLQDFMDVEYVPLEAKDSFLNQGMVMAVGSKIIIVKNRVNDGDIFLYDRTGKALRKINRMGQGGEEYAHILGVALDEEHGEIFINSHSTRKIMVYDLFGNFKRSLPHREGNGSLFYNDIFNYDSEHLICYDQYRETQPPFVLISKQDGNIVHEINIPYSEKKKARSYRYDKASDMTHSMSPGPLRPLFPFKGEWIPAELSADTIYRFTADRRLLPFAVRTPPVMSVTPEVFLVPRLLSDRYFFMETVKNEWNWETNEGFTKTYMMYDRQEQEFAGYTVYNGDYTNRQEVYMSRLRPGTHEIESWQSINADDLVEAYEKGHLKGRLKEIAATLNEESNPVIMLVKHRE